jgi:hypothetical protein
MWHDRAIVFSASTWLAVCMTNWQQLRGVYGSAAEIPRLLKTAASSSDWDAPVWQEL